MSWGSVGFHYFLWQSQSLCSSWMCIAEGKPVLDLCYPFLLDGSGWALGAPMKDQEGSLLLKLGKPKASHLPSLPQSKGISLMLTP